MRKKQIYLEESADDELRKWSALKGTSEASLIREAVGEYLARLKKEQDEKVAVNPLLKMIGKCPKEGDRDSSIAHDYYLYQKDVE
ncbi:MAG: ribbon-helix-helix domain-containing protein [Actinobacteria bacterium]|nr:ribbon-helix-helix domain-containing protein [Actinomycetota bacterium]